MTKQSPTAWGNVAAVVVILLLAFPANILLSQQGDLLRERFEAAKSAYAAGDFAGARAILEPMLPALEEISADKTLTGSAYLFLGAALERLGEKELAVVNYCRAKMLLGEGIGGDGLDLEKLRFYAEHCPPPLKPAEAEEIPVMAVASVHAVHFDKARALYDAKGFLAAKVILEKLIVDLASMEGMEPFKGKTYLLSGAVYEKLKYKNLAIKYFRLAQSILGKGKTIAGLELKDFKYYKNDK